MAGGPCTRLQSHLSVFLETTSVAVDEFPPLVLAFAAVLQAQMAYCGALPCPDTPHTLPADDLIGINSHGEYSNHAELARTMTLRGRV